MTLDEDREEAATFYDTYYPTFVSQYRDAGVTNFDVLERYDEIYERRKDLKRISPHYDVMFFWKPEKEYRAKVTFDAPSSPENFSYHSLYAMIHEHFRDMNEVAPLKQYEFVYCWRKVEKRLTLPFIRCVYGHLDFQVVEGEDPEDIVYVEFKE